MTRAAKLIISLLLVVLLSPACNCDGAGTDLNNEPDADSGTIEPDAGTDDVGSTCDQCRDDQRCTDREDGSQVCECPAGTSEVNGTCQADTSCTDTTCNGQGTCTDSDSGPTCSCELGWAGEFCGDCDEVNGWTPDGSGGCTDDPCSTVDCAERVCNVVDGAPECACPAGTHDDGNNGCEPDTECTATTCNMQGSCNDESGSPVCVCDEGWAAPNCQMCDEPNGYHDDGMGGCTTDPCLPNPCTDANRSSCVANGTDYTCECDPDHHLENGGCVPDEICDTDSCNGHGDCDDTGGMITCQCDSGYVGDNCSACDTASGYHDDGMGGCTMDPCLPNPCTTVTNKSSCVVGTNGGYACECDQDYHADGFGGCTMDPCMPDPCAANNQACRDNNGAAECYTPDCDDQNPCTDDALVNGSCVYTDVADGTDCSTSACLVDQVCTAGTCGGGTTRTCDDTNPCTDDTCDPASGCVFANDDTNVPDDGIACTDDSCSDGFASNTPANANCDDSQYCNGEEVCAPSDASADADGCIVTNVPVAPADPGPCANYGACDESNDDFPLVTLGQGDPCNDGIWCTSNDLCDANGACAGTPTARCGDFPDPDNTCTSTTSLADVIDIATSKLTVNVTVDGQPLSLITSSDSARQSLYAVDQATGTRHALASWDWYGGNLDLDFGDRIVAGVYDILWVRGTTSSSEKYVYRTTTGSALPNGVHVLLRDVYIHAGSETLDIDIPTAQLNTTVTVDGQPLSSITSSDSARQSVYAVSKSTGTRHALASWDWYGGSLDLDFGDRLVAGTYDILYIRGTTSSSEKYVYRTTTGSALPNGVKYLQKDVVISPGTANIDVDIPVATMTTNVTVDGAALSSITSSDSARQSVYAVDRDTGTRHALTSWDWYGGSLDLDFGDRLVAGTYDILWVRGTTSSSEKYVYRTTTGSALPNGVKLLQENVAIGPGDQTIDVDIPTTQLNTAITVDGQPLSSITSSDSARQSVYAISESGTRHALASWDWYGGSLDYDVGDRIVSGTYDIMYVRGTTSSSEQYVYRTTTASALPNGVIYLQKGVTIDGATEDLTIDIPVTSITTNVLVDGQPLSSITSSDSARQSLYAVEIDTGTRHSLASWDWYGGSLDFDVGDRLVAGTYDILYLRGTTSSSEKYVYRTTTGSALPNGVMLLATGVQVPQGSHVFDIDIPTVGHQQQVTVDGTPLSAIVSSDSARQSLYAVARSTGTRAALASWDWYGGNLDYDVGERFIAGVYDVLYVRGTTSSSEKYVYRTTTGSALPNGVTYLAQCVTLP